MDKTRPVSLSIIDFSNINVTSPDELINEPSNCSKRKLAPGMPKGFTDESEFQKIIDRQSEKSIPTLSRSQTILKRASQPIAAQMNSSSDDKSRSLQDLYKNIYEGINMSSCVLTSLFGLSELFKRALHTECPIFLDLSLNQLTFNPFPIELMAMEKDSNNPKMHLYSSAYGLSAGSVCGTMLSQNLTKLYLHGNKIYDVRLLSPLKTYTKLKAITVHQNPLVAQENFRAWLIVNIPSLQSIDHTLITPKEREIANRLHKMGQITLTRKENVLIC